MDRDKNSILTYLYLLYRGKKLILMNLIIVMGVAAGLSLLMPDYYKATVLLMPPREAKKGFGFAEQLASQVTTLRLGSQGSPSDLYIGIMKSQSMLNMLVDKFNLVNYYKVESRDIATARLKSMTKLTTTKEGLLRVDYEDTNPEIAASICNMYITLLDSLNQTINRRSSRERADFIDQMLGENGISMQQAEMELKKFQAETKAISPFQQQRVALSVSAELEMDIMSKENELNELTSRSFTSSNPLVQDLKNRIQIRKNQLHQMRFGDAKRDRESLFVPLEHAPALTLEYERLTRRVEALGMLEQILRQQYEEARIEQVNTTSTVSILDRAYPPMRHSRPKRSLIVLIAGAASLFFSVVTLTVVDFFQRLAENSSDDSRKVERLARFLRIDS